MRLQVFATQRKQEAAEEHWVQSPRLHVGITASSSGFFFAAQSPRARASNNASRRAPTRLPTSRALEAILHLLVAGMGTKTKRVKRRASHGPQQRRSFFQEPCGSPPASTGRRASRWT
jgi:hypothetical protein